jgi:hypothetical protein
MNKGQSETRKFKRSKEAKNIADQERKQNEERKQKVKEMPIWKKIGGVMLIPAMLSLWAIDRFMFLMLPHATHPSFKQYLLEQSSMKMTFARMIIFGVPAFIVWLIM